MQRRFFRLAAAAVLVIGIAALQAASTAEATTTCGSAGGWFDGAYKTGESLYSVSATLSNPNIPGLCGSSNSDVSLWPMIASGTNANVLGYAQSGYGRHSGESNTYYFAEYHHPNATGDVFKEGGVAASGVNYNEWYDFTGGHINMMVGSTTYLITDYDPILYWGSPWQAQWFAETHQYGDDVPGTATNPAYVSSLQIKTCRSCGPTTPSGVVLYNNSARYAEGWDTTNSVFHVYTS